MTEQTDAVLIEEDAPQPKWRGWLDWIRPKIAPAVTLLCAALLITAILYRTNQPVEPPLTNEDVDTIVAEAIASVTPAPPASTAVYQLILPSLAVIQTERADDGGFGIGTGVIINQDGMILTNLHVVDGAQQINLSFADGTETTATIDTAQPENDIAVLIPAEKPNQFVPAVIGGGPRIGDEVYAVGNPLGLVGSISAGIVSGLDRSFQPQNSEYEISNMIQIDAAVNPGNSGGPLLNRAGQVIGIVTGLVNPTQNEVFIGIGFAVPISVAASAAGGPQQ